MKTQINLILTSLVLCLVVQVFNTASLYMSISNLSEVLNFIASCSIGLGAEFAIFICIFCGSRTAGGVFAILSLFCGLLFHNEFTTVESISFWTQKHFIASTLLQVINSTLVWYLSELYVQKQAKVNEEKEANKIQYDIEQLKSIHQNLFSSVNDLQIELNNCNELIAQKETLENEILVLKKRKASASRGILVEL